MESGEGRRRPAEGDPPAAGTVRERCPRCESRDTKFCYYNNYNMSQPRHFCKSCRRYWTLGGSLRNVPIGGASRKRLRPSPAPSAPAVSAFRPGNILSGLPPSPDLVVASDAPPPAAAHGSLLPSGLLGMDEPFLGGRAGFGLGLGLGLGCGAGAVEEMGFGLGPAFLWPHSLLDEPADAWRVGSGSGAAECFATTGPASAAAAWPDLAISAPAEGGAAPARDFR